MKKTDTSYFTLSFVVLSLITGCSKKYDDALPACKFLSASPYGPDSLLITGEVTANGADNVQYVGFAYDEQPTFDILHNQVLLNGTNGQFSAVIPAIQDSTYYIKCFAANSFGYMVSSLYTYTFPVAGPDSAPCAESTNVIADNFVNYTVASLSYGPGGYNPTGFGNYGVQGMNFSATETLNISFNTVPVNGVYTTQSNAAFTSETSNPFVVFASINGYALNSGGSIYVAVYKSGTITVSFCSLQYMAFSNTYSISAKLTY